MGSLANPDFPGTTLGVNPCEMSAEKNGTLIFMIRLMGTNQQNAQETF